MREVPRTVAVPFLLAGLGLLFMFGVLIAAFAGPVAAYAYLSLIVALIVVSAVRARQRRSRLAAGRTCTCCTGTVHDPVQVI
ncbi:MAG: hypothetical protein JJD92_15910 [Frankiaceae bacterium]|nr:hypothetical protein [Frankiaceae bacterium]